MPDTQTPRDAGPAGRPDPIGSRLDPEGSRPDPIGSRGFGNRSMLAKLTVIAALMFGFGWAMVPLYRAICDLTGINLLTRKDEAAERFARNTQVDRSRRIVVEFDANSQGPWQFRPRANSLEVHPGELATMVYEIRNTTGRPSAGQAIPSYAPQLSGQYFRKVECFCFQQQTLAANETREFPVVFVVDPKLPTDVGTITLSYTFFEIAGSVGASQPQPAASGPLIGRSGLSPDQATAAPAAAAPAATAPAATAPAAVAPAAIAPTATGRIGS